MLVMILDGKIHKIYKGGLLINVLKLFSINLYFCEWTSCPKYILCS